MLALALAVASLSSGWSTWLTCRDGGPNVATAATEALAGTGGAVAVLRVSSADDHLKSTHRCSAAYALSFAHAVGETPVTVNFLSTDAAWGRKISIELDGFSEDGKRILGVIREEGADRFTALLMFDTTVGKVHVMTLPRDFKSGPDCRSELSVTGTSGTGVVLALGCGTATRWLVEPGGLPRRWQGFPDATWSAELSVGRVSPTRVAGRPVVPLRERRAPVDRVAPHD